MWPLSPGLMAALFLSSETVIHIGLSQSHALTLCSLENETRITQREDYIEALCLASGLVEAGERT
jgi:hypothetical protein